MNLAPLASAPLSVRLHAHAALSAFLLRLVQLMRLKAPSATRALDYVWVGLTAVVAVSSFWIHELRLWGPWSPIHLLSIFTLAALPLGLWHAAATT